MMGKNDRTILLAVPVLAAIVAFWFLVLSPKQDKAQRLDVQAQQLQGAVDEQQQAAQAGEQARMQFPRDYHRLVVMGKAVPVDDETASLIVQINDIARRSGVSFRKIDRSQGNSSGATATASPAPTPSSSSSSTTAPTTTSAPATESSAALLPIGATVGSAGLPTLPYALTFRGSYFQIADFMAGIDALVHAGKGTVKADGRLVTIDSFTLSPQSNDGGLDAVLDVTTYVTPANQGLTAGATPTAPSGSAAALTQNTSDATSGAASPGTP